MADFMFVGREIETPLVNAAGSINDAGEERILQEVDLLASTAIGAITVGSFTVPEQAGNEARFGGPVYYHDARTGATYNSIGLPNIGLAAAVRLMPEIVTRTHARGKPVIASVSPTLANAEIGDTFEQAVRLVDKLQETDVDFIEFNSSCPNVVTEDGGRKPLLGYDLEGMERLVIDLKRITGTHNARLGIKLPPYLSREEIQLIPALASLFKAYPVFAFLVTANTVPQHTARDSEGQPILRVPGGVGGMSGPATREIGRQQLQLWVSHASNEMEIISTLGMDSGRELAVRLRLGASAAGGVTFLWESGHWGRAVTEVISEWAETLE